jgi:hypothetical protein
MELHAQQRWPKEVTTNLLPYAIRMENHAQKGTPNMQQHQNLTPKLLLTNTEVSHTPNHWHHFACPASVLEDHCRHLRKSTINGKRV